jgi:phosphatidylinositol glycan class W
MAIDILPTPELVSDGALSSQQSAYPSPLAARMKQLSGRLPFLSVYRAHMMIMTIHCILAVDFAIFPRVQGKCENFGTSLVRLYVG